MQRKHLIATLAGALLVFAAAYYFFDSRSSRADSNAVEASNSAPPAAPKGTANPASNVANADPAAASSSKAAPAPGAVEPREAFLGYQRCYLASRDVAAAQDLSDCKFLEGKPEYQAQYAACFNNAVEVRNRAAAAQKMLADCGNAGHSLERYFAATKLAAEQGDPDARLCFLQADFIDAQGRSLYSSEDVERYKAVAPGYVDEALKRGDWRVVSLLAKRQLHANSGPVRQLEGIGKPETIYKMHRLLRYGASGDYAKGLDGVMQDIKHPDLKPEAALAPDKVAAAEQWARETYTQYFSGSPGITDPPEVCRNILLPDGS